MVFKAWDKTPRLFNNVVITEKLDGTNACVVILDATDGTNWDSSKCVHYDDDRAYLVYAQSRNRLITPKDDNAGFAAWVKEHSSELIDVLGPGYHYGEWWGSGIQRGYGLEKGDKRFSLFNTKRWGHFAIPEAQSGIQGLGVVPVIDTFTFDTEMIMDAFYELMDNGSYAVSNFMDPEGIVIYHPASDTLFKMTDNGDMHKSQSATGGVILEWVA